MGVTHDNDWMAVFISQGASPWIRAHILDIGVAEVEAVHEPIGTAGLDGEHVVFDVILHRRTHSILGISYLRHGVDTACQEGHA